MPCGVCHPDAFRDALGTAGRVYGYTTRHACTETAKRLFYMGAEHVFWDAPSPANVMHRAELRRLLKVARAGDVLIIARDADLGQRPETQARVLAQIEALGIAVNVLKGCEI